MRLGYWEDCGGEDKQHLPVNSPKNFLQTSRRSGRMFNFNSSLVRWMPSSSRVLGRVVSTSPTTCKTTSTTLRFAAGVQANNSQVQLHTPAITLRALDLLWFRDHRRTGWLVQIITWLISGHTRKSKGSSINCANIGLYLHRATVKELLTVVLHP